LLILWESKLLNFFNILLLFLSVGSISVCIYLQVWARHSNGRYYSGVVECVDEKIFAWIEYADGSFSNETDPHLVSVSSHLAVCSFSIDFLLCVQLGPFCRDRQLKSGLNVEVFNYEGMVYQGVYEGSSLAPVYTVTIFANLTKSNKIILYCFIIYVMDLFQVRTDSLLIKGVRESDLIEFGKAGAVLKEESSKVIGRIRLQQQ